MTKAELQAWNREEELKAMRLAGVHAPEKDPSFLEMERSGMFGDSVGNILEKRDPNSKTRTGEENYKPPTMFDKFKLGGDILGGLGDLASGWAALQQVGVARDSQAFKEDAWRENMARQKTTACGIRI